MIEGFCPAHANDIPLQTDRWCSEHQTLCLPPSWSSQTAVYPAWPPRPAGYVYAPRQLQALVRAPQKAIGESRRPAAKREPVVANSPSVTLDCTGCERTFTSAARSPKKQRFCLRSCRERYYRQQQAEARARDYQPVPCDHCGTKITTPPPSGPRRRFCSHVCRSMYWKRQKIGEVAA